MAVEARAHDRAVRRRRRRRRHRAAVLRPFEPSFGQQFVVENRSGGGGLIGAQAIARAEPDGYTLGSGGMSAHVLAAALSDNPGFDPIRDFTHIAFLGGGAEPDRRASLHRREIDQGDAGLCRARRAKQVPYVSAGTGTVGHMVFAYVVTKREAQRRAYPVSRRQRRGDRSPGRAREARLAQLDHRAPARAVGRARSRLACRRKSGCRNCRDLPTLRELGYPDVVTTTWTMLTAPAGVPKTDRRRRQSRGAAHLGQAGAEEAFRERGRRAAADVGGGADRRSCRRRSRAGRRWCARW